MSSLPSQYTLEAGRALVAPLLNEPVNRYVLPNGLTVILKQDRSSAVCSAQVWVKTGSIHEDKQLGCGLSHFLEHMLFKGTERRAGREISETVQEAGGYINAYTTFDRTVYYIDIPSENVDTALDVLSDSVFNSTLPADEIEKEREVIQREIDMGEDDPDTRLSHALFETAFREHPYRYPIIGYKPLFSSVTREQLLDYYLLRYTPSNVALVVTGDFELVTMKASVEKYFGDIARRAVPPVYLPQEPRQLAARSVDLEDEVQIARVGLGFQVPGLSHEDTPALDALALILGSGNSALLNQRLREELRLVHYIDATNWTPGANGVFYISFVCDPDKQEKAMAELRSFIDGLQEADFSQELVQKAVRQLLVNEINTRKTASGQAARLGLAEVVVGDIGYARNYLEKASSIEPKQTYQALKTWLRWDRSTTVTMRPREQGEPSGTGEASAKSLMSFEVAEQSNGSALLWRQNRRLPQIHLRLAMQAGPLFEEADKRGLSSLVSTLITKDTQKRSAAEVASAIESVGGSWQEFSGNNSFGLALEALPSDVDLALDILEEAILRPSFAETTFEIEKESQVAGIKEQLDDIVSKGRRLLREKFFGEHAFSSPPSGSLESVESIGLPDVRAFWEKARVASNVALAVSGDFDEETLLPRLEALLANIPKGELAPSGAPFAKPAAVGEHRSKMDKEQAVVFHAYPGPGLKAEDFYVSEVADELFSGMSSKLFERVREELSLAYFVRSSRIIGLDTGLFYFYAGASPERYGEVIAELVKETQRVMDGEVEEAELRRCQTRLKAARRMGMQTNGACAGQAALNAVYGLPANDWQNYDARIDAVSVADLQSFALKYFSSENRVELVIGKV